MQCQSSAARVHCLSTHEVFMLRTHCESSVAECDPQFDVRLTLMFCRSREFYFLNPRTQVAAEKRDDPREKMLFGRQGSGHDPAAARREHTRTRTSKISVNNRLREKSSTSPTIRRRTHNILGLELELDGGGQRNQQNRVEGNVTQDCSHSRLSSEQKPLSSCTHFLHHSVRRKQQPTRQRFIVTQ